MRPVRRADNITTFKCRLSWSLGASASWKRQVLSRPVMGLLYPFLPFTHFSTSFHYHSAPEIVHYPVFQKYMNSSLALWNWIISLLLLITRSSSQYVRNKNAIKRPSSPCEACAIYQSPAHFILKILCHSRSLLRIFPDIILRERKFILQTVSSWKRFCDSRYNSPRYIPSSLSKYISNFLNNFSFNVSIITGVSSNEGNGNYHWHRAS